MSGKIAPIIWSDVLETGVPVIDEQHKILVNMLNEANERLNDTTGREVVLELVKDLISYAVYHFDEEEELMLLKHYEEIDCAHHCEEHRSFSDKVTELHRNLVQGKRVHRDELIGFLNHWLVNHIMHSDQKFGKFLLAQESGSIGDRP
jgi:hemerythrin